MEIYELTANFISTDKNGALQVSPNRETIGLQIICNGSDAYNGLSFGDSPEEAISIFMDCINTNWYDYKVLTTEDSIQMRLKECPGDWMYYVNIKAKPVLSCSLPRGLGEPFSLFKNLICYKPEAQSVEVLSALVSAYEKGYEDGPEYGEDGLYETDAF